jgi:CBS domain-containing protein
MTNAIWTSPVRDFMSRHLISAQPDTRLVDAWHTLDQHDISALPIIDGRGALCGILSARDLLRVARLEMTTPEEGVQVLPPTRSVADVMRSAVLTVDEMAGVGSAGSEMVRHRVHRLIVLRDGHPCGVISTRDAMRAIVLARTPIALGEVMTREVKCIDLGMPVEEACAQLDDANVRGLVVVDGTWPVGVFTHTEALHALALPKSMLNIPVERMMSYELVCLDVSTPLYRVAKQARELRVRRVLAVDHRSVRGIAAGFDVLRVMEPHGDAQR